MNAVRREWMADCLNATHTVRCNFVRNVSGKELYWWTLIVYHLMFSPTDVTSYGLWLFRISTIILPSVFIINIVIIILIGYLSFVAQHIGNDRAQWLTLSELSSCRVGKRVINFTPCIGKMKICSSILWNVRQHDYRGRKTKKIKSRNLIFSLGLGWLCR